MNEALNLLRQLADSRFYGSVEIKFEAGRITIVRKTESIKFEQHSSQIHRASRGTNEYSKSI
jgi:hypothetical protein